MVGLIHDNTQVPLMDSSGFNLVPGQKHKFNYKKKTNIFAPSPYTLCSGKTAPWMQAMFDNYPNADYTYSQILCFRLDVQVYT